MRVTVLRTTSTSCPPIYEPLGRLSHEISALCYDEMGPDYSRLPNIVAACRPDWVLMIGTIDRPARGIVPPIEVLYKIGQRWPFVHLCCDGSESIWWPQLENYYAADCFALQINIDGVRVGPIGDRGMTALCPIDPADFPNPPHPWADRPIQLGFCGSFEIEPSTKGAWHPRGQAVKQLRDAGLLYVRPRDTGDPAPYREFLSQCRCVWNHAATGSAERMHVKARVIETALAGAVLLEPMGSPAAQWFQPGRDYHVYRPDDLINSSRCAVASVDYHPAESQAMARSLRFKVIKNHSPVMFWGRVIEYLVQRTNLALVEPMGNA